MGTVDLPDRKLADNEHSVDIIDIPLEPGETVMQVDLERQAGYRTVTRQRLPELGGGQMESQARDKSLDRWRYRAITVQEVEWTGGQYSETAGELEAGEEVTDVEVVP